ncbi:MAG: hypothetical protein AVDCRST_MAG30-753, partial [uncultured Solirubrobacteraceae bacterium]
RVDRARARPGVARGPPRAALRGGARRRVGGRRGRRDRPAPVRRDAARVGREPLRRDAPRPRRAPVAPRRRSGHAPAGRPRDRRARGGPACAGAPPPPLRGGARARPARGALARRAAARGRPRVHPGRAGRRRGARVPRGDRLRADRPPPRGPRRARGRGPPDARAGVLRWSRLPGRDGVRPSPM